MQLQSQKSPTINDYVKLVIGL